MQCVAVHVAVRVAMPVAIRCSALQCTAVRCSVLQCVAVCCSHAFWLQDSSSINPSARLCSVLQCVLQCALQCVAIRRSACFSALQCIAGRCNALQCVTVTLFGYKIAHRSTRVPIYAVCYSELQCVLQCVAVRHIVL